MTLNRGSTTSTAVDVNESRVGLAFLPGAAPTHACGESALIPTGLAPSPAATTQVVPRNKKEPHAINALRPYDRRP